ncbi:O-antigen ligase family protein [Lutimonas halocynthiae]|uniref:O-antigen ligase family protein n=1 Tax=Lutimonas halocynthiae TaxID=1446477 RepID=UPI0025B35486|nr:O-antigen ligase family protein [Lutimonas halocynthiae]MDN3641072.1 O-antigen ligase family protein [Lutimonas halocynthiae]
MKKHGFIGFYLNALFFLYGLVIVLCDNFRYISFIYLINAIIGCSFVLLVLSGKVKIYFNTFFNIYLIFVVFAIASSFWAEDFYFTARRALNLVLIFLNIFFIYNINKEFRNYRFIIYGVLMSIFVNFLWFVGLIDLGLTFEGWRFQGSVLQANNFVYILMFGMMMMVYFFVNKREYILLNTALMLLFLITILLVVMTASKAGLLSVFVLILILLIQVFKPKYITKTLLAVVFVFVLFKFSPLIEFVGSNSSLDLEYTFVNLEKRLVEFVRELGTEGGSKSTSDRVNMIKSALEMWGLSPVIGNGMAAYEFQYGHYSHNNVVELLSALGIIGFLLYYSIFAHIFSQIVILKDGKLRIILILFLLLYFIFDQSIVSYTGKFKILSLLMIFLIVKEHLYLESS